MVAQKTCTIILFLVCIQFYFSIQAVIQPADVCGDDSDPGNKRHNKIDKVKNTEYMTNIKIFIINNQVNCPLFQRCRSQRRNSRTMCQCCGTTTFFVEYGTICRRYIVICVNIEFITRDIFQHF